MDGGARGQVFEGLYYNSLALVRLARREDWIWECRIELRREMFRDINMTTGHRTGRGVG